MSKTFVVDIARCSGCYNCQLACKDEHAKNDWLPYAAAQPLTGQFWCRVEEHVHGTIPKVKIHYESQLCRHCDDAACQNVCPAQAIYRREDGFVLIDPAKCTGCRACVTACPFGMVYFNEEKNIAQKCTGCAHLLDGGLTQPRCVEACPTDALRLVDSPGEDGLHVVYKNRPGRFIGGLVYDPVEKEVIVGAQCALSDGRQTLTDDFGDFWFHNLPEGTYDVTITAPGYARRTFSAVSTQGQDVNLGDIPLERA
jgi:Fe-S-cluster-containing dehydrogenase component